MPTIPKFQPPALLDDFENDPNLIAGWDQFIEQTFNENIADVESEVGNGNSPFYNPKLISTDNPVATDVIRWKGFPLLIAAKHPGNRRAAWQEADQLLPNGERPQDEYLEWFVAKDQNGKVTQISFTCEGPEYWEFLAEHNRAKLLSLYQQYVNPAVAMSDLFRGQKYNRLNKWNTTGGAMHLNQHNNTLSAEINIAAQATILRQKNGTTLTDADALIRCGGYGAPGRASDPHIGSEVNTLARAGYAITLLDPVGLYMEPPDTTGWVTPDGTAAVDFWKSLRGAPGMTVRSVFEVPAGKGYVVGDIKIGGANIEYGGQLADKITMKLTGIACRQGSKLNTARPCRVVAAAAPHLAAKPDDSIRKSRI